MIQPLKFNSNLSFSSNKQNGTMLRIENPLKTSVKTTVNNSASFQKAAPKENIEPQNNTPIIGAAPKEVASVDTDTAQQAVSTAETAEQPKNNQKKSLKIKILNFFKNINNIKDTTFGAIKGALEGVGAFALISVIGKQGKENEGKALGTLWGLTKSFASTVWSAVKIVPDLLTKAPVENIKNASQIPVEFCKRNLKNNKKTAAIATVAGLGIMAFETIRGKMKANRQNSNIDHNFYLHHTKEAQ